jgi:PIN domain nuclease of toxin-antitoxin system
LSDIDEVMEQARQRVLEAVASGWEIVSARNYGKAALQSKAIDLVCGYMAMIAWMCRVPYSVNREYVEESETLRLSLVHQRPYPLKYIQVRFSIDTATGEVTT